MSRLGVFSRSTLGVFERSTLGVRGSSLIVELVVAGARVTAPNRSVWTFNADLEVVWTRDTGADTAGARFDPLTRDVFVGGVRIPVSNLNLWRIAADGASVLWSHDIGASNLGATLPGMPSTSALSLAVRPDGAKLAVGGRRAGTGDPYIQQLSNLSTTPTRDWGMGSPDPGNAVLKIIYLSNSDLVSCGNFASGLPGFPHVHKWNSSDGSMIWRSSDTLGTCAADITPDGSGGVYAAIQAISVATDYGRIHHYNSSGTFSEITNVGRDVYSIERAGGNLYAGTVKIASTPTLIKMTTGGSTVTTYDTGGTVRRVVAPGNGFIYAVGDRGTSADATASVWKFDMDLNYIASYDTGGNCFDIGYIRF